MRGLAPVVPSALAAALLLTACGLGRAVFEEGSPPPEAARQAAVAAAAPAPAATEEATPTAAPAPAPASAPGATVTATPTPQPTPTPAPTAIVAVSSPDLPPAAPTPEPVPPTAPEATPGPNTPAAQSEPSASPTPLPPLTPAPTSTPLFTVLNLTGVQTQVNPPGQIQFVFSPRDEDNHAIFVPAEQIQLGTRIFERFVGAGAEVAVEVAEPGEESLGIEEQVAEALTQAPEAAAQAPTEASQASGGGEWVEIDYDETSFFVHAVENFEVVFVLDFTNSMVQTRLADGTDGVNAILGAFFEASAGVLGAHRIGLVEFHDRNEDPAVLSELTTDRDKLRKAVSAFVTSRFDSGSSRVWDSIEKATTLFTSAAEDPNVVKAIVFFSDGRDTSSSTSRAEVGAVASGSQVQLYAVGVGNVLEEEALSEMVLATGGVYYPVTGLEGLQTQMQLLVNDLRGQYKVSYLTLRRQGSYNVRIDLTLGDVTGVFESATLDVASFYGPDTEGRIAFDRPSVDSQGEAQLFVRALHVPRNIKRFRFMLDTDKAVEVRLVPREERGLLEGWELSAPDAEGYYEVSSRQPLEFGNFGLLFQLIISGVTEETLEIPVQFDNSIYSEGKSFLFPPSISLGAEG